MDHLAGFPALVADDQGCRFEGAEPVQPEPAADSDEVTRYSGMISPGIPI